LEGVQEQGSEPPEPPSGAPPAQEDILGRRISAALIDLALLIGLLLVVGLTIGESDVEGGSFSVYLNGADAALYFVLVLLYYFGLEAIMGQTVGKLLLGLRVIHTDGRRPSVWAIAVRSLIRVVDWLPLLYLVGFIAMQATGLRRQRLGDLAAKTSVARAPAMRHRGLALAFFAVFLVLIVALFVYRAADSGGVNTYRAHGITFDYPAGWQHQVPETAQSVGGGALWRDGVAVDDMNLVVVEAYRLNVSVTEENLDEVEVELESLVRRLFEESGGALQAGPEEITMGGLPSVRFRGRGILNGTSFESTLVFAFDGTTEYFLNCQHTREKTEVERGCDQIVRTFRVE
jgi:uncharacterized RDD family membrane protein YckC